MSRSQSRPSLPGGLAAACIVALAVVVGCSAGAGKDAGQAPRPEPTVEAPTVEPEPESEPVWPLTGAAVASGTLPGGEHSGDPREGDFGPVLSVKIENSPGARPQRGLERADLVWEQLVEGGMTRFVAMFHSDTPAAVGPIRSVRPMDAAIAGPARGVLAFSGGLPAYVAKIAQTPLVRVSDDAGSSGFYRDPGRGGDHSLFGHTEDLLAQGAGAQGSGAQVSGAEGPPQMFTYPAEGEDPSAVARGSEVAEVAPRFPSSSPSWVWAGQVWQRLESGQPATAESGARLEAANVVVARVEIRDTGNRDGAGAMVPETILTGSGEVAVFTGGKKIEGTWEKGEASEPLQLLDADGDALTLGPGKTWVELVPTSAASG